MTDEEIVNARVKDSFDGVPYLHKLKNNKMILKAKEMCISGLVDDVTEYVCYFDFDPNEEFEDNFDDLSGFDVVNNIQLQANWIDIENKNIWNPFNTEIEQIKSIGNRIGNDNNVYGYEDSMNIYLYYYDNNNSNTCYIIDKLV